MAPHSVPVRVPRTLLWALTATIVASIGLAGCVQNAQVPHDHMADGHHHGTSGTSDAVNLPITGDEADLITVQGAVPEAYRFTPDAIEVQAGQRIGIEFTNDGVIEHEFSLNDIDFHLHAAAGDTDRGAFIAPEPGQYVFGCYIPGHFEGGMKGTLIVT